MQKWIDDLRRVNTNLTSLYSVVAPEGRFDLFMAIDKITSVILALELEQQQQQYSHRSPEQFNLNEMKSALDAIETDQHLPDIVIDIDSSPFSDAQSLEVDISDGDESVRSIEVVIDRGDEEQEDEKQQIFIPEVIDISDETSEDSQSSEDEDDDRKQWYGVLPQYQFGRRRKDTECVICREKMKSHHIVRPLQCMHTFHKKCINAWFQYDTTCPTCRFQCRVSAARR